MGLLADREELAGKILEVIGRGAAAALPDDEFDDLALRIFAYQFENNPIYRAYCVVRGVVPGTIDRWTDIPAVPADAFKAAPLLCGDPESARTVFRTSGTTQGTERRGAHYFLDTGLYEAALLAGFTAHLLPDRRSIRILSLVPSRGEVPDSSLSFMISEVVEGCGTPGSGFFVEDGRLHVDELVANVVEAIREEEPVLIVGTSLAFVHLLDALAERDEILDLPPGSRAMDTGGFKGSGREVGREALYRGIRERLSIPEPWVVNEYGMTEMSSQFYDGVAGSALARVEHRSHSGPGWVRSLAVDPETLEPLGSGSLGVMRHVDLANLDSVMAIQTADMGRVVAPGIELRGRASGAETRGCSIAMDDLLSAMQRG